MVSHAGTGSALADLAAGRFAVMVASRVAKFGEAGDDHQARARPTNWRRAGLAVHRDAGGRSRWTTCWPPAAGRAPGRRTYRPSTLADEPRGHHAPAVTVVAADPVTDPLGAALADRPATLGLFTSPPWIAAVCGTYGFTAQSPDRGRRRAAHPVGGVAWVTVDDARGRRLLSLPFSDRADPLVPGHRHLATCCSTT